MPGAAAAYFQIGRLYGFPSWPGGNFKASVDSLNEVGQLKDAIDTNDFERVKGAPARSPRQPSQHSPAMECSTFWLKFKMLTRTRLRDALGVKTEPTTIVRFCGHCARWTRSPAHPVALAATPLTIGRCIVPFPDHGPGNGAARNLGPLIDYVAQMAIDYRGHSQAAKHVRLRSWPSTSARLGVRSGESPSCHSRKLWMRSSPSRAPTRGSRAHQSPHPRESRLLTMALA